MGTEHSRPNLPQLGMGFGSAIVALFLFAETFPQAPGHDVGGPAVLLWISVPIVAIGGVLLGNELTKLSARPRHRLIVAIFQVVAIGVVVTPALVYGRVVAPQYFEREVILLWYWAPIAIGAVLVAIQHGYWIIHENRN